MSIKRIFSVGRMVTDSSVQSIYCTHSITTGLQYYSVDCDN